MCNKLPCGFIAISIIFSVLMFPLNLFLILYPFELINSNFDDYPNYFLKNGTILQKKYYKDNYTYQTYLTDIEFGENMSNYTLYGLTGEKSVKCYLGSCENRKEQTSKNCSEVCAIFGSSCFVDNKTCNNINCELIYYCYDTNTVCYDYNEIKYWRGQNMKLTTDNFYFNQLRDTVSFNEECKEGFKQCGYLNKEKDKLCISASEICPINKIIIKDDNITPTDFEYETRQFGEKYLFFTNQNINHSIYINIIADSGINSTNYTDIIDNQSITNFLSENPHIYNGYYTSKNEDELSKYGDAKLKACENSNQSSLEELKKSQEKYIELINIYTEEKLNEMNKNAIKYGNILEIFSYANIGIINFIIIIIIGIYGILSDLKRVPVNPIKNVLIFYLICFPNIFLIYIILLL